MYCKSSYALYPQTQVHIVRLTIDPFYMIDCIVRLPLLPLSSCRLANEICKIIMYLPMMQVASPRMMYGENG